MPVNAFLATVRQISGEVADARESDHASGVGAGGYGAAASDGPALEKSVCLRETGKSRFFGWG
jgi:hypothetical protein